MSQTSLLLLFGGESSEHDVSLLSARNVYGAIDKQKYHTILCYIDRHGKWWYLDEFPKDADVNTDDCDQLLPVLGNGELVKKDSSESLGVDVIFPVLHGRNGEDGTVQGLAQLLHVPIVGCDVTASGIAMNKLACKQIVHENGIDVIPYKSHYDYQDTPSFAELARELGETLFVKPARAGSSVGVSKVRNQEELDAALHEAHRHDQIALIEKAITGQELEVAVLGTPPHHKVSGVGEIIPGEEFYTYEDKYAADSTASVSTEANISKKDQERVREYAERIYQILDCKGLSRIDFILSQDGTLYLMEVNTLPGFTSISMYPKLWQRQGLEYAELVDELVQDALA